MLLGFAVFYVYELARGGSADVARVVSSTLLIAVFGAALLVLGRTWLTGADWPRTPTLVWNVLLLPVAWGLYQGGQGATGTVVGASAVVGLGSALAAGRR